MSNWYWKEGLRFALAGKLLPKNGEILAYKMSAVETFGSALLRPLYWTIDLVSKHIKQPLAICLFTMLATLVAALIFYNIPAFMILGKLFPSKAVRCLLFLYVEINCFALGCRAFGRFNNEALVELWKGDRLVAIFPGDAKDKQ